jgi:hypothetical protein
MLPRWQSVAELWPTSTGTMGSVRDLMASRKLRMWFALVEVEIAT